MLGKLEGSVSALRVVKVYNQQGHEVAAFDGINRSFLRRVMRIEKVDAATQPLMEFFGMIAGSAANARAASATRSATVSSQPSGPSFTTQFMGSMAACAR